MALAQTKAASIIQEQSEEISSHKIISLLMDGALERVDQAVVAFNDSDAEQFQILINKLVAIINGLRNSLNLEAGGEIATNLDALYDYITHKLLQTPVSEILPVLNETKSLIGEVKGGWDNMDMVSIEFGETQTA